MRNGLRVAACLFVAVTAAQMTADVKIRPAQPRSTLIEKATPTASRVLPFRSLLSQIDTRVMANLLTDAMPRANDVPLSVIAGEVDHCEDRTCSIPLTIRVTEASGPLLMGFAVSSASGELSRVRHFECGTASCSVTLILERGHNTISVGIGDAIAGATAYTTIEVNADRTLAKAGRTEWF